MIKKFIKTSLEYLISYVGLHIWPAFQPKLLILMYHRILPPTDPRYHIEQPGMTVHPDTFAMHLKWLKKHFTIVDLEAWLNLAANNQPLPKKACAITFDDGWKDNYQHAYPILVNENCPATIYLVADYINTQTTFWPEKLSYIISEIASKQPELFRDNIFSWLKELNCHYQFNSTTPSRIELDEIICAAKKHSDDFLHAATNEMAALAGINLKFADILDETEIKEMLASGIIKFGSHTATHTRMSDALSNDVLDYELVQSKENLQNKLNTNVSTFCYPNGDITENAATIVEQHYQAAITTREGWNSQKTPVYELNRMAVHEDSSNTRHKFFAKISGLL